MPSRFLYQIKKENFPHETTSLVTLRHLGHCMLGSIGSHGSNVNRRTTGCTGHRNSASERRGCQQSTSHRFLSCFYAQGRRACHCRENQCLGIRDRGHWPAARHEAMGDSRQAQDGARVAGNAGHYTRAAIPGGSSQRVLRRLGYRRSQIADTAGRMASWRPPAAVGANSHARPWRQPVALRDCRLPMPPCSPHTCTSPMPPPRFRRLPRWRCPPARPAWPGSRRRWRCAWCRPGAAGRRAARGCAAGFPG